MTALEYLAALQRRGIRFTAAGDRLEFSPASALIPEEVEALRRHKPEILAYVRAETLLEPSARKGWPVVGARVHTPDGAGVVWQVIREPRGALLPHVRVQLEGETVIRGYARERVAPLHPGDVGLEPKAPVPTIDSDRERVWHVEAEVVWRCDAMWRALARHGGRARLQAKPGRHPHEACGSCGDPLPPAYAFTCLPCSRAAGLVRWVAWERAADGRARGRAA